MVGSPKRDFKQLNHSKDSRIDPPVDTFYSINSRTGLWKRHIYAHKRRITLLQPSDV